MLNINEENRIECFYILTLYLNVFIFILLLILVSQFCAIIITKFTIITCFFLRMCEYIFIRQFSLALSFVECQVCMHNKVQKYSGVLHISFSHSCAITLLVIAHLSFGINESSGMDISRYKNYHY